MHLISRARARGDTGRLAQGRVCGAAGTGQLVHSGGHRRRAWSGLLRAKGAGPPARAAVARAADTEGLAWDGEAPGCRCKAVGF